MTLARLPISSHTRASPPARLAVEVATLLMLSPAELTVSFSPPIAAKISSSAALSPLV